MKQNYSTQLLRAVAAQICQTIGWQSVTASSLEILVDILDRYMKEICKSAHNYTELYNRTESNLDDLGLAFRDMGIDMSEIVEYIQYVDPIVPASEVPKYPISKESHFNFLKPGSKEVLTRPVHIHEHLPPLNPPEEDEPMYASLSNEKEIDVVGVPSDEIGLFKRPADGGLEGNVVKKTKQEEEGRATREITSVMMTTSGFLSPAREGKLPEAKPPNLPPEFPRPTPPPMDSPPFKSKDSSSGGQSTVSDKKLEKKLKKRNHDKEKRKDKPQKEKHQLPAEQSFNPVLPISSTIMPREANEQMIIAERKKELKKLKMKSKADLGLTKKRKEKVPKQQKQQQNLFEPGFLDKAKFDPFQVIPQATSNVQAHNFLTGAAHSIFPNPLLDAAFGSSSNPLIEGKLVTEPDKNKLNIFKKISKPKDDPIKSSQIDFISPPKFDRFDSNQPSTSQQVFNDPMKKVLKLPKETTLTRVEEGNTPINFSMPRSNESSFEELAMPKTPTIPRTPDAKLSQGTEKKEKKERKKKERKVDAPDWNQSIQNPFMQDFSSQNNPFLQTLKNAGGMMGNLANFPGRNPFSLPANDMFQSGQGLMPQSPFGMTQLNQMNQLMQNSYGFGMDMNMIQQPQPKPPKPKKVKQPKQTLNLEDEFLMMQSRRFSNVAPLVPQTIVDRFDGPQLMNVDPFPLQHHQQQLSSFDQLLKEPHQAIPTKKFVENKMETFDLTSSPEPITPALHDLIAQPVETHPLPVEQQHLPPLQIKEKTKEKKKKKDKDKEKEKDKDERKKKKKEKKKKKDKHKEKHRASMSTLDSQSTGDTEDTGDNMSTASIPKLMLKLNSPRPNTPDTKKMLPRTKNEDFDFPSPSSHDANLARDPSPELVRISPLVTRPPKQKPPKKKDEDKPGKSLSPEDKEGKQKPLADEAAKLELPTTPKSSHKSESFKRKLETDNIVDSDGSTVWICPACGKVDDGMAPMIGCDACDAWYHWACVGIKIEPKENDDWFCRACISRKQSDLTEGKKKKRKKKDKDKRDH